MSRQEFFNLFNVSDYYIMGSMLPILLVRKGEREPFAQIVTHGERTRLVVNGEADPDGIRFVID